MKLSIEFQAILREPVSLQHAWECAWCRCWFTEGGQRINKPAGVSLPSHGICQDCKTQQLEALRKYGNRIIQSATKPH